MRRETFQTFKYSILHIIYNNKFSRFKKQKQMRRMAQKNELKVGDIVFFLYKNKNRKAIIISSQKNASGLDLSFVKNVIIFEPIIGEYNFLRDTERQIIGRVFRINQKENVNVFRLIIRNTIEEEIYKNIIYNLPN